MWKKSSLGRSTDLFFLFFLRFQKKEKIPPNPKKILLANWANLGDVVIATAAIRAIKEKHPHCQIGFLTSSHSRVVVESHPLVDFVHSVDFWLFQREKPLFFRLQRYRRMAKQALKEIRAVRYDVAIDLYPFFPNSIWLLWRSRIAHRLGFTSGGFGEFLTHPGGVPSTQHYLPKGYEGLLAPLELNGPFTPIIPRKSVEVPKEPQNRPTLNFERGLLGKNYWIVHCCASQTAKEWETEKWKEVTTSLTQEGIQLVYTGKGARERAVVASFPGMNLCDQLSWSQFVEVIARAQCVLSVDSVPIHLAATFGVPFGVLMIGNPTPDLWMPEVLNCVVLKVDRKEDLSTKDVLEAVVKLKNQSSGD